jgi:hypothetical protein
MMFSLRSCNAWHLWWHGNKNSGLHIDVPLDPKSLMLIWDTGASFGSTPFQSDFSDYVACTIPVWYVTKVNNVIGIGTTLHKFTDTRGFPVYHPCVSYHLPQTDIPLFSPQTYHKMHGGYSEVYSDCIKMLLKTSKVQIQIVREKHGLMYNIYLPTSSHPNSMLFLMIYSRQ